jgi:hypothetical protein
MPMAVLTVRSLWNYQSLNSSKRKEFSPLVLLKSVFVLVALIVGILKQKLNKLLATI